MFQLDVLTLVASGKADSVSFAHSWVLCWFLVCLKQLDVSIVVWLKGEDTDSNPL